MICLRPDQIPDADRFCEEILGVPRLEQMRRAGHALAQTIRDRAKPHATVVFLCGDGNNGGDGFAAAAELAASGGFRLALCVISDRSRTEEANAFRALCDGIRRMDTLDHFAGCDILVDCLLGTGARPELSGDYAEIVRAANLADALRVACDVPTGANAATGETGTLVFRADVTVTMMLPKIGLYSYPARSYCGKILLDTLGIETDRVAEHFRSDFLITDSSYAVFPPRKSDSHKGTFGRLLAICGSERMPGAAMMACEAALRGGVGLVSLAAPRSVLNLVSGHLPEPIQAELPDNGVFSAEGCEILAGEAEKASAMLIGCGLGTSAELSMTLSCLIRAADIPIILDADALNALAGQFPVFAEEQNIIITPHPLEFSRLCLRSVDDIQAHRIPYAREFAAAHHVTVVLKGASTVIARPDGRVTVNTSGSPALAKGGSGDVLAGLIAALAAQGIPQAPERAVFLHGLAGEQLAKEYSEYGVLPSALPAAIARLIRVADN